MMKYRDLQNLANYLLDNSKMPKQLKELFPTSNYILLGPHINFHESSNHTVISNFAVKNNYKWDSGINSSA